MPFPPIKKGETAKEYSKRCMNYEKIAAKYPNRKIRKKILEEYHKSVPPKQRNIWFRPGKTLFTNDAARYLGISRYTLMSWIKKGWIRPGSIVWKKKNYSIYDIETLDEIKRVRDEAKRKKQESRSNKMDPSLD